MAKFGEHPSTHPSSSIDEARKEINRMLGSGGCDLIVVPRWKAMEFVAEEILQYYGDHSLKGTVGKHILDTLPRLASTAEPWQRIVHITIIDHTADIQKIQKEIEDINKFNSFRGKLWFVVDLNLVQIFS